MDYKEINDALVAIIERRAMEGSSSPSDELKNLEEQFLAAHENALKEIMLDIQDEYFPDTDMEPMMAYVAKQYYEKGTNQWGKEYITEPSAGVAVEIDDYPRKDTHIVMIPNPLRVVLHIDEYTTHQIWNAQKPTYVA